MFGVLVSSTCWFCECGRCVGCFRKLAKFILVLIPLFGIMYLVFYVVVPSGFENNNFNNVAYLYLEMAYNSFQVSPLLCHLFRVNLSSVQAILNVYVYLFM